MSWWAHGLFIFGLIIQCPTSIVPGERLDDTLTVRYCGLALRGILLALAQMVRTGQYGELPWIWYLVYTV